MTTVKIQAAGVLAASIVFAAALPVAAQPSVGQQVTVLESVYEVVSFDFRAFETGDLYELLLPAGVYTQSVGDGATHSTLTGSITVVHRSGWEGWEVCAEEVDGNYTIAGFPALVHVGSASYSMTHSYTVQEWAGDRSAAGINMLAGSGGLFMSIRIDALTCVQITLPVYSFGQEEEEVDRGVHRLGRYAPTSAEFDEWNEATLALLDYFDIRRAGRRQGGAAARRWTVVLK